jgi:hypothetical protein
VYSNDRVFVSVQLAGGEDATTAKQLVALEEAGHPIVRIGIPAATAVGGEFFRWEIATATAGAIMGVNPFDEPDVAESKQNTQELLSAWQRQGVADDGQPVLEANGMVIYVDESRREAWQTAADCLRDFLHAFLGQIKAPDYLALLPYFQPTPARHEALQALRKELRNRLRVATTLGYGPRYLHSTGQLRNGGPNTGVFVMFTATPPEDLPIPGQAYGFATLQRAQALGDFRALSRKHRRVIRIHLGDDIGAGFKRIAEGLE